MYVSVYVYVGVYVYKCIYIYIYIIIVPICSYMLLLTFPIGEQDEQALLSLDGFQVDLRPLVGSICTSDPIVD